MRLLEMTYTTYTKFTMNYHILTDYGFTEPEVSVFQILLESGESNVTDILSHTTLSRTSVHDALGNLLGRDMLDYRKDGRNAYYKCVHPNKLYALLEEKKQATARLNAEMEETIRGMVGSYNLSESKPGVRFFEGVEGGKEVTLDTLRAQDEIYTFLHPEKIHHDIATFNTEYVHKRIALHIPKKMIVPDTPTNRTRYKKKEELREVRFLPLHGNVPFDTSVQIYNKKVSFATLSEEKTISVLIEDSDISYFHKQLFLYIWKSLESNQAAEAVVTDESA